MMTKLLAVAAVLAMSPAARASMDARGSVDAEPSCSYTFDATRAMEAAPGGCPVATWQGGGYDAIHMMSIPADEPAPTPALAYLAQLWSVP